MKFEQWYTNDPIPENMGRFHSVKTTDSCGHPIIPTQTTLRYRLNNDAICKEVLE